MSGAMGALLQASMLVVLAPLLQGLMRTLGAKLQERPGPPPLQPYFDLARWFCQESLARPGASWIAEAAPGIVLGSALALAAAVPLFVSGSLGGVIDVVALVFVLALARFALTLAALDTGTSFAGMAASREMTFASLVEPVLLLALLAGMARGATSLASIGQPAFGIASALALIAFVIVVLAETARIPVDNQETHYELTMIHEGLLLNYGGWQLALLHAASYIKQIAFYSLAAAMLPGGPVVHILGILALAAAVGIIERTYAKLRLFRVPDLFASGALLALASLLLRFGAGPPA